MIELYGLCIYLGGAKYCTGHKLVMDFKAHVSTLYSDTEELSIEDGANRLLAALGMD